MSEVAPPVERADGRGGEASSPLVSQDGAADVEPDALPVASLHHLAAASAAGEEGLELGGAALPGRKEGRETLAAGAGGGLCIPRSREWTVGIDGDGVCVWACGDCPT
jgi:hypothetical protein